MNAQHLTTDELADAAEGLLDPERAAFAESHIADCPDYDAQSDALRAVSATLQAEPTRPMPKRSRVDCTMWLLPSTFDEPSRVSRDVGWNPFRASSRGRRLAPSARDWRSPDRVGHWPLSLLQWLRRWWASGRT